MPTEAECTAAENPKHTTFVDSQGSTFTFNDIAYGATSVNLQIDGYDSGDQTVDLSTLSLPSGCCRPKVDHRFVRLWRHNERWHTDFELVLRW